MAQLKMDPPWVTRYKEIRELFAPDPDVHVIYDNDERIVTLYVDEGDKAYALEKLLPPVYEFGTGTLTVKIVPANKMENSFVASTPDALFDMAFFNNDAYQYSKTITGIFTNNLTYVVFTKVVVQYANDNLGDIYGNTSTLYEVLARDVFGDTEGVCFCTDKFDPILEDDETNSGDTSSLSIEWP
jgi:hypothetical protein